mmetsp:Transcript_13577/g.36056  ORF Transcript_13577/g.36056 Transcript_13577/m.36056 type:complete len:256 (-) Transcript_13577:1507-2274(-)
MPYTSVSGTTVSPRIVLSQPGESEALSMSNSPVHSTLSRGTTPRVALITCAPGFRARTADSTSFATVLLTRSTLLSTITSANSTWLMKSGATLRSSSGSALPSKRSRSSAAEVRSTSNDAQSTTVTHVSSFATSFREAFPPSAATREFRSQSSGALEFSSSSFSSTENVSATSMGSLTPVDSMTMASNRPSFASPASSLMRSSRRVQHMHPLCSSTIFSSRCTSLFPFTSDASMFTSAISFTSTATFFAVCFLFA